MNLRIKAEFIVALILILFGGIISVLPIFSIDNVKIIFSISMILYGVIHLIKNLILLKNKEYSGFFTFLSSIIVLILLYFLDVENSPWNLALILFIWVCLNAFIKLKETDYYHDRKNKVWLLNIINLILFIVIGILTAFSLNYTGDIQILVIGYFLIINGILELMDPITNYILENK